MPSATSILHRAADLIAGTGWTQRAATRDRKGDSIDFMSPKVTCFCAFGAILRAASEAGATTLLSKQIDDRLGRVLTKRGYDRSYINWNDDDGRTAAEVIALLREAAQ